MVLQELLEASASGVRDEQNERHAGRIANELNRKLVDEVSGGGAVSVLAEIHTLGANATATCQRRKQADFVLF